MNIKQKNKKAIIKAFKQTGKWLKKGYLEGKEALEYAAPRVNRFSNLTGRGIQESFRVRPSQSDLYLDFTQPKRVMKRVPQRKRVNVDWNNLGIDI
ncbi:MAG: hypothetical protein M0R17_09450 [Candidatus Omnitrophica bacterium]|jgi:hypothetical protein|nr:hypothetical protein [Candidatus Omnitrophota bacterium]